MLKRQISNQEVCKYVFFLLSFNYFSSCICKKNIPGVGDSCLTVFTCHICEALWLLR